MKKSVAATCLIVCAILLPTAGAWAANTMISESGWFNFGECDYCKALAKEPGLLEHTTWENHAINDGMMNIVTVRPEYAAAMVHARQEIQSLHTRIEKGEVDPLGLKMCNRCQALGKLIAQDVLTEEVRGELAVVTLVTSDDPVIVKKLHELARRDTEEMALLKNRVHSHGSLVPTF